MDDVDLENAPHCLDGHTWRINEGYAGPETLYTCTQCPAAMFTPPDDEPEPRAD
jgi:hypothetical protein